MKIKKMLSIILTMNGRQNDTLKGLPSQWILKQVDRIYDNIQTFESLFKSQGTDYETCRPELPTDKVRISVKVIDPSGSGVSSTIRFFPLSEDSDYPVNRRINFYLRYSDSSGLLNMELPRFTYRGFDCGRVEVVKVKKYRIEVSKGSEFLQNVKIVDLQSALPLDCLFRLKPLIDMRSRGWFAGDLHHHSVYSSPVYGGTDDVVETPDQVMNAMTAQGLSFGALSDHHNILNHRKWLETESPSFLPIVSKEISTSNGHVMSLNVSEDIIYQIPQRDKRSHEYLLGEFVRITRRIKELGGLAQINHPRDMQEAISLSREMTEHIDLFETVEIWNGSIPMLEGTTNDSAVKLWFSLLDKDLFIAATTGSDTHNIRADDYNEMFDQMFWFAHNFRSINRDELEGELLTKYTETRHFIDLFEKDADKLELWAKSCLGTACVRTYVSCPAGDKLSASLILESLRKGRSILTNGPLLFPELNGKTCGETLKIAKGTALDLTGTLCSNRKIRELELIGKRGCLMRLDVSELEPGERRELSVTINPEMLEDKDWIVCKAYSDHTNMLICNPVFIEKQS